MRSQFKLESGSPDLPRIPGVVTYWRNPFGAGPNIIEVEHVGGSTPEYIVEEIRKVTGGETILTVYPIWR